MSLTSEEHREKEFVARKSGGLVFGLESPEQLDKGLNRGGKRDIQIAMDNPADLLRNNRIWAAEIKAKDPNFFQELSEQQTPRYLWIGCSDSRVPSTQLVGMQPGDMFVHRNVANVVVHTDFNCLSVLQFAVDVLKVDHIIVCGHYNCGGIKAAFKNLHFGLIDNWLRHVQDVMHTHTQTLAAIEDETERIDRLCELNVEEQVLNVSRTTIVQNAWSRGQHVAIHGWIYSIVDGLLHDLNITVSNQEDADEAETAVANS